MTKVIEDILKNYKTIAKEGVSSHKKKEDKKNLKRKTKKKVMKYMKALEKREIQLSLE